VRSAAAMTLQGPRVHGPRAPMPTVCLSCQLGVFSKATYQTAAHLRGPRMNSTPRFPVPTPGPAGPGRAARSRTLDELKAEQGIHGPQDIGQLFGAGADLWASDEEFEEFLEHLRAIRRERD